MSTRKNPVCSFLSRLALCALAAALILLSPALVKADTIRTFDVSGSAINFSHGNLAGCADGATCAFSGMFQVDTTTGTVESSGFDITFPGSLLFPVDSFDNLTASTSASNLWEVKALDNFANELDLVFTTAPTGGSLVGFTGGSIVPASSDVGNGTFLITAGNITPVPEPSSLDLFASGMLVLGLAWRFGKKVGHPLSA